MSVCLCGIPYEDCCGARETQPSDGNAPFALPPLRGWECPRCGRINAPHVNTCGCDKPRHCGPKVGDVYCDLLSDVRHSLPD